MTQSPPTPAPVGQWRSTALVAAVVLGAYLLLLNPFWTPGGDSEMFLSAARSILRGEGYTYNGKPVYVAPPAWPYVMAGAMAVSPTFLMLKGLSVALMTAAWVMAHRTLLRFAPPRWATTAAVLGALLVPVYSLTFWLHSEPLFCALSWGAALLAVRAAEARAGSWAILGVVILCGAMAAVRWTSGLQWGIVAAILLGGVQVRNARLSPATAPAAARPPGASTAGLTLGLGMSALITLLVFLLLFFVLPAIASAVGPSSPSQQQVPVTTQDSEDATPGLMDNTIRKDLSPAQERLVRLVEAGHWPAWVLWYPTRFASGMAPLAWVSLALGWLVILLLGVAGWRALFARGAMADLPLGRFLWPALVGYVFLLVLAWPLPNARYLVPVAPLLVMGVFWGCRGVGEMLGRPRAGSVLIAAFTGSLILANGAMYAVDARIQRSGDAILGGSGQLYYARYEAGLHPSLLRSIDYLRARGVADGELAVSERYSNLGRMRFSKAGPRNVVMLLDRQVVAPPNTYSFVPGEIPEKLFATRRVLPGGFPEWARRHGVKYYLYQQPTEPWRLWHFRLSPTLQERLSGKPPEPSSFGWLLFTADDDFAEPVALPEDFESPRRVPGL